MKKLTLIIFVSFIVAIISALLARDRSIKPPGLELYTPTKYEWTILQLEARYRQFYTNDDRLSISFVPSTDWATVRCLMQYSENYPAAALKTHRESVQYSFNGFVSETGWNWLLLRIEERVLTD